MTGSSFGWQLDGILERDVTEIVRRQERKLHRLTARLGGSYVLFGAGHLGRAALSGLRKAGVEPVAFADNNPDLWNRHVDGLQVLPPGDAAARFSRNAIFVITVYTSELVWEQVLNLGVEAISFAELAWNYPRTLLPHGDLELPYAVFAHADEVRAALSLWEDDRSRREYVGQLEWHTSLDRSVLPPHLPQQEIYFPDDIVQMSPDEVFVDCGAFNGDTVQEFLKRRALSFGQIIAIEPDPANHRALTERVAALPEAIRAKITTMRYAVGSRRESVEFNAVGSAASAVGSAGFVVECAPLDELLAGYSPTFVKMDIEGAEADALAGARGVIMRHAPVLAICLYHKLEHLWQIPLLIRSYSEAYRLFLRRYADECWELVCYAIPTSRID